MRRLSSTQRLFVNMVLASIMLVFGVWIISGILSPEQTKAAWFNTSWLYRQTVPVANAGSLLYNAQVPITIDTATLISAGKMRSDCKDIRVVSGTGKLLKHWVHECNTATSRVYAWTTSVPAGNSNLFLYYGNATAAQNTEVVTGTTNFPGISCKTILDHGDGNTDGQYFIDPNAGSGGDKFQVYCDMTTNSGGWTIVHSSNGTVSQQPLTSNTEVAGNPFSNASSNYTNQKKQDVSLVSSESLFKRSTGVWLKASVPIFDGNLTTASQHPHSTNVTLTANDGTTISTAVAGYSNYNNASGGDYGITTSVGFDHHSTGYYHLRGGCGSHYLYRYGTTYNVNTTLGSWTQTHSCVNNGTQMGPWYSAMRGTVTPVVANITLSSPTNEEQSDSPAAFYKLDEGQGTLIQDASSNKNNGTVSNATWKSSEECIVGSCLFFTGTNSVTLPDPSNSSLDFNTGDFTISVWIRTGTSADNRNIIRKGAGGGVSGWRFGLSNGIPNMLIGDTVGYTEGNLGSTSIADNNWHHLVIVYDRDSNALAYVDGNLVGTRAISTRTGSVDNSSAVVIGNTFGTFTGFLDQIKIYPYARSAAQVNLDFNSRGSVAGVGVSAGGSSNNSSLSNGLVAHWKMDEASWNGTSNEVVDSSGNSNNGTSVLGALASPSAKFGNSGYFAGNDEAISVADSNSLDLGDTFTISLWAKRGAISVNNYIMQKGAGPYAIGFNASNQLYLDMPGTGNVFTSTAAFTDTTSFHHIVFAKKAGSLYVYYDGVLVPGTFTNRTLTDSSSALYLGSNSGNTSSRYPGNMDEVRLYNRQLSPSEIQQLYAFAPGPAGYWDFEDTGTSVTDKSGGGQNGSFLGEPANTPGKYGKGLSFDGNNDGVQITATSALKPSKTMTVEAWVDMDSYRNGSEWGPIVHGAGNLNNFTGYYLGFLTSTSLVFYVGDGSTWAATSTPQTNVPLSKWAHVTGVIDGSTIKIYVNGALASSANHSLSAVSYTADPLKFGRLAYCCSTGHDMDGKIDEVRIYNYARTAGQITSDMNASHPLGGSPVGSQALYYKFDEGFGTIANDSSPDPAPGALSCQGAGCGLPEWKSDGKFGKALYFNSADTANNPTITLTASTYTKVRTLGDVTISAWINPSSSYTDTSQAILRAGQGADQEYSLYYSPTNKTISFSWYDGAFKGVGAPNNLVPLNAWSYVAVVRSGTTAYFYVNGRQVGTGAVTAPTVNAAQLSIGRTNNAAVPQDYSGYIDEVKIYTAALTADEIKIDYNRNASLSLGSAGTNSSGVASNSASTAYCIPGDTSTCSGPIAHYNFEEKSGASVQDISGNGNTATKQNTPIWIQGKVGSGMDFDNSADYLTTSGIVVGSNWTVSTWSKFPLAVNGTYRTLMRQASSLHHILADSSGLLGVFNGSFASSGYDVDTLSPGWHQLTAVGTGGSTVFYIDGRQVGTSANQVTGNITQIGGVGSQNWGAIDEMRIYDYVRTPGQIAYDYNRGAPVAHWKMNECQGGLVNDSSGNGNAGTITIGGSGTQTSAGTCQTGSTAWGNGATGKFNGSLNFDGTDDYIDAAQPNIPTSPNAFTITGFIKPTTQDGFIITPNSVGIDQWLGYDVDAQRLWVSVATSTDTNVASYYSTSNSVPTSAWTHFAVSINNRDIKIYINGKLNASNTHGFDIGGWTGNWRIGQRGNSTFWYSGQLDDLQVFSYPLTLTQIKGVMNQSSSVRFGP